MLLLYLYKNLDYPLKYCKNLIIFLLQLLFKQTKDMSPEGVKQIIRVIKAIENEEESRH